MQVISLSDQDGRRMLRDSRSSVIYVGLSDGASSVIVALDAGTAQVRWKAELSGSQPYCMPYEWGIRCVAGGELVDVAEREGTVTELATLPSDSYRIRKGGNDKSGDDHVVYLLPVDGRPQDYQVVPLRGEDHAVILPWSPPPTPCAEASGTSFKDVDPHTGVGDHDLLAAVVVDGWMVLSSVDTGEIVDQRFGDLHEEKSEFDPLLSGNEACGSEWSQVDVSYPLPPHGPVFSVVPLPAEKVPASPPADEARPVFWTNGESSRWYVTPDGEFGEWYGGSTWSCDVDLRGSRVENAFTDGIDVDEGVVRGTKMGGLTQEYDEYWVMVSGGGMVSTREDNNSAGGNRRRIVWSADIGDDEWKVRGGAVMTRDSDGRVTARSIDRGEELWVLDTPGEMRWERGSGEPRGSMDDSPLVVLSTDSRALIYGHRAGSDGD